MAALLVGRVGWLEVALILAFAAVPVLLVLMVTWLARLTRSPDQR